MLVCGGVVGNLQALCALCAQAERLGIPSAHIVCTGDIAAYCADGAACADLLRSDLADALVVRGNCERTLADDEDDCGCGFAAGSVCDALSAAWYRHNRRTLSAESKAWFATLPSRADVEFAGRHLAVIHGGSDADNTFIFPSDVGKEAHLRALGADIDGVIAGHCGVPFTQACGEGGIWHNSGALGMPANDGTARVWYALWEEVADGIRIRHCALEYDHAAAAAAMADAGLPEAYQQTLSDGIWPSDSVLPPAEKAQQGVALEESEFFWESA